MNYARIEILSGEWGYNNIGDILKVVEETEDDIYFFDAFHRWCYVPKIEEGKTFRYIPKGERSNKKHE